MMKLISAITLASTLALPLTVGAQEIIRHKDPNMSIPIAQAVEVPNSFTTVYVSGVVPQKVDADADPKLAESWGDTKTQTISVLETIKKTLESRDLTMGDIVKMQVYLVTADGAEAADFDGFMQAYSEYFGTEAQPNLPARSTMIVDALVNPNWLVEIEVTAARKAK